MAWKLYEGNCFDYLPLLEDKSIDMILCDLPYGTTACKWDTPIPLDELWVEYKRVIKDNGAIVLFGSEPFSSHLRLSNIKNYKYDWKWDKTIPGNPLIVKYRPHGIFEDVMVFGKNKINYYPIMEAAKKENIRPLITTIKKSDLMNGIKSGLFQKHPDYDPTKRYPNNKLVFSNKSLECNPLNRVHPTQKPVALFEYLIKTYTNEDELVLDNCAGSGTTGVACENTGRNSIMMEKEPEYCQIIKDRMATVQELQLEARKQKTLNEFNGQATLDMPAK